MSGPMGRGCLYTADAEAENSAVNFSKEPVPPLLRWAKTRVLKTDTLACRNARFRNTSCVTSVSKWILDLF